MRKRKKSNCIFKKTGYWIIGLLAVFIIGFEAYRMVASCLIERKADKEWPTRDLTSGSKVVEHILWKDKVNKIFIFL